MTAADNAADSTTTTSEAGQPEASTTTTTTTMGERRDTSPSSTTTTGPAPAPSTTTTTAATSGTPPLEECRPSALRLVVTTDRDRYRVTETVSVHAVLRNIGPAPCRKPSPTGYAIVDERGQSLFEVAWSDSQPADGAEPAASLDPGEQVTYNFTWDQNMCEPGPGVAQCRRAETGSYAARMHWGPPKVSADSPPFVLE